MQGPPDAPPVVIENPVLNSPYLKPTRHFKFTDDGITEVARRYGAYVAEQ
jgi:hypothetical protein